MNLGVFAFILTMERDGQPVEAVADLAGLSRSRPGQALAVAVLMFSLAGLPPMVGFFAKFFVFKAAVDAGLWPLAVGRRDRLGDRRLLLPEHRPRDVPLRPGAPAGSARPLLHSATLGGSAASWRSAGCRSSVASACPSSRGGGAVAAAMSGWPAGVGTRRPRQHRQHQRGGPPPRRRGRDRAALDRRPPPDFPAAAGWAGPGRPSRATWRRRCCCPSAARRPRRRASASPPRWPSPTCSTGSRPAAAWR